MVCVPEISPNDSVQIFRGDASIASWKLPLSLLANVVASIVYWPGRRVRAISESKPVPASSFEATISPFLPTPRIRYKYGSALEEVRSIVATVFCANVKL